MGNDVRYVIKDREQSQIAEAFRALCAFIQDKETLGKMQSVLFTSAVEGEGGAMTAVNAAAALAYSGNRVILLECDLRSPILREGFGLHNLGLTTWVEGGVTVEEVLQDVWIPNLKVVTSGPVPVGPISVLSNERTREFLDELKTRADYLILTSSPILVSEKHVVSDACVLASKVDGVALVIDSRKIQPHRAQKVVELLNGAKARIIGAVLNDLIGYEEVVYHAGLKRRFTR